MSQPRVVVVGNGMVGQRFLEELVKRGGGFDLTAFCDEPRAAYDRVQLTSFFSGKSASDLSLVEKDFFEKAGMTLRLNDAVLAIDPLRKVVRSARYKEVPYDKLVLATGSYPFVPAVPGKDRRDCFVYRTIEDLEVITATSLRSNRLGKIRKPSRSNCSIWAALSSMAHPPLGCANGSRAIQPCHPERSEGSILRPP